MNPRHCSKVLDTLSSFENLAVILKVDFSDVDAFRAALSGRNQVLLLFVRHAGGRRDGRVADTLLWYAILIK